MEVKKKMTFTNEEEEILKLMAAETKARMKYAIARDDEQVSIKPLMNAHNKAVDDIKLKFKKL